jgi:hypothetical protein
VRRTIAEVLAVLPNPYLLPNAYTAVQQAFVNAILSGDVGDRLRVLEGLMLDVNATRFTHSPRNHYAQCAPTTCTYTTVTPRTIPILALEAVSIFGGTATTILGLIGWILLYASYVRKMGWPTSLSCCCPRAAPGWGRWAAAVVAKWWPRVRPSKLPATRTA